MVKRINKATVIAEVHDTSRAARVDVTQATDIVIAACINATATATQGAAMRVLLLERGYRYIDEVTKSDWRELMQDVPVVVEHIEAAKRFAKR